MKLNDVFNVKRLSFVKPLYCLGLLSALVALLLIPVWLNDPRTIGEVSVWEKPIKFFISSAIFTLTYSWLGSFISGGQRLLKAAGLVITISLTVELILITLAAAFSTTSHFNVSSPLAITIWSLMATFISLVLASTVVLSFLIIRNKENNSLLRLGLGIGSINTAIGMALAFLMTSPTANQLANFQGIAGAHSVGVADGGPGLPLLGWSTVAGDLRVGHFFGLHSIQVAAAFLAMALILPVAMRIPLLIVGNSAYLGVLLLATIQALRAEPFASPSELTLITLASLLGTALLIFGVWSFSNAIRKSSAS